MTEVKCNELTYLAQFLQAKDVSEKESQFQMPILAAEDDSFLDLPEYKCIQLFVHISFALYHPRTEAVSPLTYCSSAEIDGKAKKADHKLHIAVLCFEVVTNYLMWMNCT